MAKLWTTMIIAALAGAANAAAVRPAIPIYDAASLAEACATGLADAARLIKRLGAMPLGNAGSRDLLDRWDRLRIRLEDFEGPVDRGTAGSRVSRTPSNEASIAANTGTRSTAMLAH